MRWDEVEPLEVLKTLEAIRLRQLVSAFTEVALIAAVIVIILRQ